MYAAMQRGLQEQECKKVCIPLSIKERRRLFAGQRVLLYGELITLRDRAHTRLFEDGLPIQLKNQVIYYAGGTRKGIFGPTTSLRMDGFILPLLEAGIAATLGKGPRSKDAFELMKRWGTIYFLAVGGAAAFLSQYIVDVRCLLYPEMGPEAIYSLRVEGFPAYVAWDTEGRCIWKRLW